MVGSQGHSREDPIHTQQHIPVHLALPKPQVTLQDVFIDRYLSSSHLSFCHLSPHLSVNSPLSPHQGPLGWGHSVTQGSRARWLSTFDHRGTPWCTCLCRHTVLTKTHRHKICAFLEKVDYWVTYTCPKTGLQQLIIQLQQQGFFLFYGLSAMWCRFYKIWYICSTINQILQPLNITLTIRNNYSIKGNFLFVAFLQPSSYPHISK